jgi:hypothetical protein
MYIAYCCCSVPLIMCLRTLPTRPHASSGAGTVAAGLRAGKPTLVCPFFGDQFFWGHYIWVRGLGPKVRAPGYWPHLQSRQSVLPGCI